MKKIILIVSLLFLGCITKAQDTLTSFKPSWFYNYHCPERLVGGAIATLTSCDITKVCYTDQPRYIYGVAVAARTLEGMDVLWEDFSDEQKAYWLNYHPIIDTSFAHCEEFIRVYELNKDTITILREGLCNLGTPASYYLELPDEIVTHGYSKNMWTLCFYEIYFDAPLWVTDSFYVGMTQYLPKRDPVTGQWPQWPLQPAHSYLNSNEYDIPFNNLYSPDSNCDQWYYAREIPQASRTGIYNNYTRNEWWMFPIVDSNTWHPNSPEAIASMSTAPAVNVSPNPTTGVVSVQSEHNISYIEIYNSQGQLVDIHNTRASSCELDISDYRSGVYFLHIYTSGGTVSKRVSLVR